MTFIADDVEHFQALNKRSVAAGARRLFKENEADATLEIEFFFARGIIDTFRNCSAPTNSHLPPTFEAHRPRKISDRRFETST